MSQKMCAVGNRAEGAGCGPARFSHCVAPVDPQPSSLRTTASASNRPARVSTARPSRAATGSS